MQINFTQPTDEKYDFLINYHIDLIEKYSEQKEHLRNKLGFYSENQNEVEYHHTMLMMKQTDHFISDLSDTLIKVGVNVILNPLVSQESN